MAPFIPAMVVIAAVLVGMFIVSWSHWMTGVVVGLTGFAVWAWTREPSVRVQIGLAVAALVATVFLLGSLALVGLLLFFAFTAEEPGSPFVGDLRVIYVVFAGLFVVVAALSLRLLRLLAVSLSGAWARPELRETGHRGRGLWERLTTHTAHPRKHRN